MVTLLLNEIRLPGVSPHAEKCLFWCSSKSYGVTTGTSLAPRDNVPVQATRELVRLLKEAGDVDFEYWEVPGMDHGTRSLGEERGDQVRIAMLNWLLDQPVGIGGPPLFGESPDE